MHRNNFVQWRVYPARYIVLDDLVLLFAKG